MAAFSFRTIFDHPSSSFTHTTICPSSASTLLLAITKSPAVIRGAIESPLAFTRNASDGRNSNKRVATGIFNGFVVKEGTLRSALSEPIQPEIHNLLFSGFEYNIIPRILRIPYQATFLLELREVMCHQTCRVYMKFAHLIGSNIHCRTSQAFSCSSRLHRRTLHWQFLRLSDLRVSLYSHDYSGYLSLRPGLGVLAARRNNEGRYRCVGVERQHAGR